MTTTRGMEGFVPADVPVTAPVTKFGGRPVWLDAPRWPVNEAWDEPMCFVCQIALEPVLGEAGRGRIAYVFVTHADHGDETFFDPDVVFPDEGANAVVVQPGGTYRGATLPTATGPTLYHPGDGSDAEYTVRLRPPEEDDPAAPLDGDKIGGVPAFFQGDGTPEGGPWVLALQLDANFKPFTLHLGASPTAYVFVSTDGAEGRMVVQDS
ncbi:hypothetical protein [Streptomyces sp. NPDC057682]|uniref:hypothetical protein n=1 Tax=Streptomyces sp. NPDC057682 TaxID=3346210 RepID=UPI0036A5E2FB